MKSSKLCWICHSPNENNFQPCLCKGTLSYCHQSCLSKWATERYKDPLNQEVKCPNCKFNYNFQVVEVRRFPKLSQIKLFDSKEKITLLLLIIIQMLVLSFDFFTLVSDDKPTSGNSFAMLHIVHYSTVTILLIAAGYNIVDMVLKQTRIQILSK